MKVLKADSSSADAFVTKTLGATHTEIWLTFDVAFDSAAMAWFISGSSFGSGDFGNLLGASAFQFGIFSGRGFNRWLEDWSGFAGGSLSGTSPPMVASLWRTFELHVLTTGGSPVAAAYVDGTLQWSDTAVTPAATMNTIKVGQYLSDPGPGSVAYITNVKAGTTRGASDLFADDFSSGNTSAWTSVTGSATVVSDPFVPPVTGRVLVAWDDGPLEPNPTWTALDQGGAFPDQFVSGYDIKVGRQTLISQTDTGTATVYINDHELGLFDDRNLSSPFQGKLSGRQIKLQLYDPVTATWEEQFGGLINNYSYAIDGSASDANGDPINASIQLECVDMFDYLNGFGLTPGLAGVAPPSGMEDGVYYAATAGPVHDRIVEILADANVDSTRYLVASGNTKVIAVKYDPGESALTALRDAADAEFPFIANIYVDRHGAFAFRGRYSRFDPDDVAAEPASDWDFTRWGVGDEKAILADPTRAQMRTLSFARDRASIINVAMCWTQSLPAADMINQIFADTSSITAYGQHSAPPMSDLLTADYAGPGTLTPGDGKQQCYLFAKLLVKNQAFPREALTSLQVKSIQPDDYRAAATWAFITRSDISHIVNVRVGYPGGTGFTGTSPRDDYYIEGRALTVRPLNPTHDYVEYNVEVSPAVWSMDTHSVFPDFAGGPTLSADFTVPE